MDYHIENRVVLSANDRHQNLYSWSIKEFDAAGKQIGGDKIPWAWNVFFAAHDLSSVASLKIESGSKANGGDRAKFTEVIQGKLKPLSRRRDVESYSMFGTKRKLESIDVLIYKAALGEEERCHVWGSPSYTSEWDFENVTEPDCLQFYLHVLPDKFGQLSELLRSIIPYEVVVRVGRVNGFYSEWSPSIRTYAIKVLASAKEQQLENPEGLQADTPVLGQVGEFEISFKRQSELKQQSSSIEDDDSDEMPNSIPAVVNEAPGVSLSQLVSLEKLVRKSLIPLWLILAALLLLLFK